MAPHFRGAPVVALSLARACAASAGCALERRPSLRRPHANVRARWASSTALRNSRAHRYSALPVPCRPRRGQWFFFLCVCDILRVSAQGHPHWRFDQRRPAAQRAVRRPWPTTSRQRDSILVISSSGPACILPVLRRCPSASRDAVMRWVRLGAFFKDRSQPEPASRVSHSSVPGLHVNHGHVESTIVLARRCQGACVFLGLLFDWRDPRARCWMSCSRPNRRTLRTSHQPNSNGTVTIRGPVSCNSGGSSSAPVPAYSLSRHSTFICCRLVSYPVQSSTFSPCAYRHYNFAGDLHLQRLLVRI